MITPVSQGLNAVDNLSHVALTCDVKNLELVVIFVELSIPVVLHWRLVCLLNWNKMATFMSVWPGDVFFVPPASTNTFQNSTIAGENNPFLKQDTQFFPSC